MRSSEKPAPVPIRTLDFGGGMLIVASQMEACIVALAPRLWWSVGFGAVSPERALFLRMLGRGKPSAPTNSAIGLGPRDRPPVVASPSGRHLNRYWPDRVE